jgi:tRNA threonylcarbamoyladenosine biosynthesis protein TsaB
LQAPGRFLAFDTSTDRLSVGLAVGPRQWLHEGPGGAQASASLIPAVLELLAQAGLTLKELDAIVFGRGPGSFTGLRTACAVAQGLAAGARLPVLPVDTLLAVAEDAAHRHAAAGHALPTALSALLDARMNEVYTQDFEHGPSGWQALSPCRLMAPEQLVWPESPPRLLAGNVFEVYGARLLALPTTALVLPAWPTAAALLRLAPGLMAQGLAVPAAHALPLYVRDKVAQTTDERLAAKAAAQAALPSLSP